MVKYAFFPKQAGMNKKKDSIRISALCFSIIIAIIAVIAVIITITLIVVLENDKKEEKPDKDPSLDDIIADNSTFPNGSYKISVDSLTNGLPGQKPLFVNLSMLNDLGLRVDNSSLVAETNRLSYFFVRLPSDDTINARVKRQSTNNDRNIGIRFGNSNTINVIPLNLSMISDSGLSLLGALTDNSQVYQLEIRMADAMCSDSVLGSCSIVKWTPYSISNEKIGSKADFNNELPVACGSQCTSDTNSPCAKSCSTCDGQQVPGADTPITRRYNMGTMAAKNLQFIYETYTIKDRITVKYEEKNIFDSGCVGTEGEKIAPINFEGNSVELRVDVELNCEFTTDTAWYFTLPCVDCKKCKEYQCLDDSKAHCGPKGYLIGYGLYFCNRYYDYYNEFDAEGQKFIDCVRPKLMAWLENYLGGIKGTVDCNDLYSKAFDSHPKIYIECDFCAVLVSNFLAFWKVIDASLLTAAAWQEIGDILSECSETQRKELCEKYPDTPCVCKYIPSMCH